MVIIKRRVTFSDGSFIEYKDIEKDIAEAHAAKTGAQCFRVKEEYVQEEYQQEQDGGIFTTEVRTIKTESVIDESGFLIKSWWETLKGWFGSFI